MAPDPYHGVSLVIDRSRHHPYPGYPPHRHRHWLYSGSDVSGVSEAQDRFARLLSDTVTNLKYQTV